MTALRKLSSKTIPVLQASGFGFPGARAMSSLQQTREAQALPIAILHSVYTNTSSPSTSRNNELPRRTTVCKLDLTAAMTLRQHLAEEDLLAKREEEARIEKNRIKAHFLQMQDEVRREVKPGH